ncbi:MAG: ABC transporter permease [Blautia sp.]|jgi:ABC-2 type transport system permease protein
MKVFKTCLSITRRHLATLLIYFSVFSCLCVVMTKFSYEQENSDFTAVQPNYTLINRDGDSALADGLSRYLNQYGKAVSIEDKKEALQDASFFHASDYIAILPEGFANSMKDGHPLPVDTVTIPDSARGFYMSNLTEQYLHMYRSCQNVYPNMTEKELSNLVLDTLSVRGDTQLRQLSEGSPLPELAQVYLRLYAYISLVLIILNISTILMVFRRPDLNLRHAASPLKPLTKNLQMILFGGCIMLLVFLVLTLTGALLCRGSLTGLDPHTLGLLALNMLTFSLVSLSIAMLCSNFIRNSNLQNAVANLISLGLSFLGGIFVPLSMLGNSVLQAAKLTPTYWYSITAERISGLADYTSAHLAPVFWGLLIQLGFAAALFAVSLVIARYRSHDEQPMGTINTEYQL